MTNALSHIKSGFSQGNKNMILFVFVLFSMSCTNETSQLSIYNFMNLPRVIVGVGVARVDSVSIKKGVTTSDVLAEISRLLIDG